MGKNRTGGLPLLHVAVIGSAYQEGHLCEIDSLFRELKGRGFSVEVEERFAGYLKENGIALEGMPVVRELPVATDVVISIGGDGTFLRAAQWVGATEVPILGINTGHLGFLASYTPSESRQLADLLAGGGAWMERRSLLHLESETLPEEFWPYALNEVAVQKEETSSMINIEASIDGYTLADYLADGLIIATPTGSTAYNLSAGGPILEPTLECMCLSPIAPHTLTLRPLVVSGDADIRLRVTSRAKDFRISLDGRSFVVHCGGELRIRKALFSTVVVRRPDDDFPSILREKLLWGKR